MRFWPSASSPPSQDGPSASTSPAATSSPLRTMGRWLMQPDWLERWNFGTQVLVVLAVVVQHDDGLAVDVVDHAGVLRDEDLAGVDRDAVLDAGADERRVRTCSSGTA